MTPSLRSAAGRSVLATSAEDVATTGRPADPGGAGDHAGVQPDRSRDAAPDDELTDDARISAVLAVLRGATVESTARQWAVDVTLLQRWVGAFVDAGTAKVSNRPDQQGALHRDRFLAAFAYEMREPLTIAQGWMGVLGDDDAPVAGFRDASRRLAGALDLLADRVADAELLVAAALGGLEVHPELVTVRSLIGSLTGLDASAIRGKGPDLEVNVDPRLFSRILRDLWNAADLAPQPRSRRLMVTVIGPWVELRVLRDAEPIDIELLQALYEPFDAEHLRDGVRTGLYLARALTVAHGGTLGVDQDESGAALWVRVPHRPDRTGPSPAQQTQ